MEPRKTRFLLPTRTEKGWQQPVSVEEDEAVDGEHEEEMPLVAEKETEENSMKESSDSHLPYIQLYMSRQKTLASKKAEIAGICSCVVRSPDEHYAKLKLLRALCLETNPVCAVTVRRLAIHSLAAVFKDITPGYYIRELTSKEKAVKVSKEVKKLRDFEQGLLTNYRQYVGLLERYVQAVAGKMNPAIAGMKKLSDGSELDQPQLENLAVVAAQSMCVLLQNLSHFNYSKQLVHALIPRLDSKQCQGRLAEVCLKTLKELFCEVGATEATVEAVRTINEIAKTRRGGRLGTSFVEALLCFKSTALADAADAATPASREERQRQREARAKLSRKEKKNMKAAAKLDKEMLAAQATESRDKRVKLQTELLQLMFSVYFRILKQAPHSHLLPAVLEGLARFSHLINVDFFTDLFQVLDRILSVQQLSVRERLLCVQTAFQVLSAQEKVLDVDPRQFYCHLYQCLLELCGLQSQKEVPLAVECLEHMLRKRRQVSIQRVLSFVKRVTTVCLHQDAVTSSLALLREVSAFMRTYSCAEGLLDSDIVTSGVFQPEVGDPEYSHADCTSLWEVTLLQSHYNVQVRESANKLAISS